MEWDEIQEIDSINYVCGHCGNNVAVNNGYDSNRYDFIAICHFCGKPTYFETNGISRYALRTYPGQKYGDDIDGLEETSVKSLYNEARSCIQVGAYTASVLCCRKLIMNFAVEKGEKEDKSFQAYVNYLDSKGFIPVDCKGYIDKVRLLGNDATHEIKSRTIRDAKLALDFIGLLFKFNYEFRKKLDDYDNINDENS